MRILQHFYQIVLKAGLAIFLLAGLSSFGSDQGLSTEQPRACICNTEMNILYIGVINPMNIAVAGIPDYKVRVTAEGGDAVIAKRGTGYYTLSVKKEERVTIRVSYYDEGVLKSAGAMEYRARSLPDYVASWGMVCYDNKPKPAAVLRNQKRIFAHRELSNTTECGPRPKVIRYNLTYIPHTGDVVRESVEGNRIPESFRNLISEGRSGDRFVVDNIQAVMFGSPLELDAMVHEIE